MGNKDSRECNRCDQSSSVRKEEHVKEYSGGPAYAGPGYVAPAYQNPSYGGAYKHEEKHKVEDKSGPYGGKREETHKEYTSHQGHL